MEYEIPEGYKSEFIPKEIKVTEKFGEYSAKTSVEGNKLRYKRQLMVNGGHYTKSDYNTWMDFLKIISKADNQKAVFIKNQ
jgi:primase-polymerase (primpol)-like protein